MKLTPKEYPNGKGFFVAFHHPLWKKTVYVGLDTQDRTAADSICIDAVALFNNSEILQEPTAAALVAYERKALDVVFGKSRAEEIMGDLGAGLTPEDMAELKTAYGKSRLPLPDHRGRRVFDKSEVGRFKKEKATFVEAIGKMDPRGKRLEAERRKEAEKKLKVVTHERDQLEDQVRRLGRERNVHVKIKIGVACDEWKSEYAEGHADQTRREAVAAVESFLEYLEKGRETLLRDINAGTIDKWIAAMKREDGVEPLSPVTKSTRRRYLSTFYSWSFRRYDLHENPMDRVAPIPGAHRGGGIKAIDRLADIQAMISTLEPHPYWQAWAAIAIFVGPRWSEQKQMRLKDVYLDAEGDLAKVPQTKTVWRKVPIEQTILKPIMAKHVKQRQEQISDSSLHTNLRTDFLFPSLLGDGIIERKKSEPGTWSHGRAWHTQWGKVRDQVKDDRYFWEYGPDEWRHTFGTMLAHCGWTSLEISHAMGNSPQIAEKFYIASAGKGTGTRWPLRF